MDKKDWQFLIVCVCFGIVSTLYIMELREDYNECMTIEGLIEKVVEGDGR